MRSESAECMTSGQRHGLRLRMSCRSREWLKDRPGTLADYNGEVPKLDKGETVLDAIERHRRRGSELKADLNRIRSAPYPSSHCKAQMRAQIEELGAAR